MADDNDFIDFTPNAGFDIRKSAPLFVELMKLMDMPLVLHLADGKELEFAKDCSEQDIIESYERVVKPVIPPSHGRVPKGPGRY